MYLETLHLILLSNINVLWAVVTVPGKSDISGSHNINEGMGRSERDFVPVNLKNKRVNDITSKKGLFRNRISIQDMKAMAKP